MPIWFELLILMLVTYVIGLGIGWVLWGRGPENDPDIGPDTGSETGPDTGPDLAEEMK